MKQYTQNASPLISGYAQQLDSCPEKPAFVIDDTAISYSKLASLVAQISAALAGRRELRIALAVPNSVDVASWYIACLTLRHTLFIFDTGWNAETRAHALQLVDPDIVVSTVTTANTSGPEGLSVSLEHRATHSSGSRWQAGFPDGDFLFLGGFTSGSSGLPKAYVRKTASWLASFERSSKEFGVNRDTLQICPGPLSHGLGFYAMAESLFNGASFMSQREFDPLKCMDLPGDLLSNQENSDASLNLVVVPTMLYRILATVEALDDRSELPLCSKREKANMRIVTAGAKLGSVLRLRVRKAFPLVALSEYYGASELSFVSVSHDSENRPADSVGRVFDGVEVAAFTSGGDRLEDGEEGVLHVQSDMVCSGYLQQAPDGLRVVPLMGQAGWCSVADRGRLETDGNLYLLDRVDRMLISGGLNVYPSRVEQLIETMLHSVAELAAVQPASQSIEHLAVFGLPDEEWGDKVCVVLAGHALYLFASSDPKRFSQFCKQFNTSLAHVLEAHEVPRQIVIMADMPMTQSGKIAFSTLPGLLAARPEASDQLSATRDYILCPSP